MAIALPKKLEELPLDSCIFWKNPIATPPIHVPELSECFHGILDSKYRELTPSDRVWVKTLLDPHGREGVRLIEKRQMSSRLGRPMVPTNPEKILKLIAANRDVLSEKP